VDLNVSQNGNHRILLEAICRIDQSLIRLNFQDSRQMPRHAINSKGIAIGYTAILSNSLINNLRYGYIRQGPDWRESVISTT